jgi:hypothetical protein
LRKQKANNGAPSRHENKYMKKFVLLSIIIIAFGCAPIKRHQRLVEKFPFVHTQDTLIIHDTIREFIPKIQVDSIFHFSELHDTIFIEKERLKIRIHAIHDSIFVEGECDSIFIEKIIERKIPIRYYEAKESNWWKWILAILAIFTILAIFLKRKSHEKDIQN